MARFERFPWLKRDGAPLAISLVLHVLALLLIAPWLVMRTIPTTQVEVEVMLEPDDSAPARSRPEQTVRQRGPVQAQRPPVQRPPLQPQQRPPQTRPIEVAEETPQPPTPPVASAAPDARSGQGQRGGSAPAPREVAGLSAPNQPGMRSATVPSSAGATILQAASEQTSPQAPRVPATREAGKLSGSRSPDVRSSDTSSSTGPTPLQRGSEQAGPVAPRAPSQGSTPQPSARAAVAPSRPGEDRQDGLVSMVGPDAQAQAAQPEFRQAARQGGQASMRGGSQAPADGLANQPGLPDRVALLAARPVPQAQPGSAATPGVQAPALTAPAARSGNGQGSASAQERAVAGLAPSAAVPSARSGAASAGQAPALATPSARSSSGQGSTVASENTASSLAQAAPPAAGAAAVVASRAPASGGQTSAGSGSGSRTASPAEQSRAGLMAAATAAEPGVGTASSGAGPGASEAGQGRSQALAGGGSAAREAASSSALLAAETSAAAARAGADSSSGRLSGRAETVAMAQPVNEARAAAMQTQQPTGEARVIEERFTASTLQVDSPRSICSLPLMFAGLDRRPIPEGLDSINTTAARLADETPPRHHPGNQAPRYPIQAIGLRAEGRVLVRAEIRPDGTIGKRWIKQSSGQQVLDLAALETVRGWRFFPAQRHGLAVAVWIDVPIEYKLP